MHILTQHLLKALKDNAPFTDIRATRPLYTLSDLHNWHEMLSLYEILADDISKETFTKLIILRTLYFTVPSHVAKDVLSLYPKEVWDNLKNEARKLPGVKDDYIDDRIETWILKGYEHGACKAEKGDIVIDAGPFTGNTTVYFAQCVGEDGKVIAFEPMPETYEKLKDNVGHLPQVDCIQAAVSHKDGEMLIANQNSCGASIFQKGDTPIVVRSIDSFMQEKGLNKLDFLKMDIEGAEMDAIYGAKNTIEKLKPKMAICIYHKPNDLYEIYRKVLEINPYYKFYLKHSSNTLWETVLFCMPSDTANKYIDCSQDYGEDICFAHILRNLYKNIHEFTDDYIKLIKKNDTLEEQVSYILRQLKTK